MTRNSELSIPSVVWMQAALIFAIGVWMCWPALGRLALTVDNQHYFFISERAASGVPPHVSQFDPKHTLSLLMSGAAIFLGRGLGIDDVISSRIVSIFCGIGSWSLVFLLVRHFTASSAAGWFGAMSMASLDRYLHMVAMGSRPKVFLVFFTVLAVWLIARNRPKSAGLAAAASFLCWQPALLMVAIGWGSLILARRWRDAMWFLATAALLVLLYEGYFLWHGALGEQIEQAYRFPSQFMSSFPEKWGPVIQRFTWIVAVTNQVSWRSVLPLAFLGTVAAVWIVALVRPIRTWKYLVEDPARMYCFAAAHATFAFTLTSYQGFPDRFFVEPFMAVGVSLPAWFVLSRLPASAGRPASAVVTAVALVAMLGFGQQARARYGEGTGLASQRASAARLGEYVADGNTVYCVGCTHLLAFNHMSNYTKYGFFFRGVPEYIKAVEGTTNYIALRNGVLPDIVLVSRPKYIRGRPWLKSEYVPLRDPAFGRARVTVYVRKPNAKRFIRDSRVSASAR
jgi:hypothetical protein